MNIYLEVGRTCYTEGEHLFTRIRDGSIVRDGVRYNVKHVLMGGDPEQASPGYYSVCGEYTCVLPEHLRAYVKPKSMADLSTTQVAYVKQYVPEDLWSYFGV